MGTSGQRGQGWGIAGSLLRLAGMLVQEDREWEAGWAGRSAHFVRLFSSLRGFATHGIGLTLRTLLCFCNL